MIRFPPGWRVLGAYMGALVLTQVYWYNFAPLISLLVDRYGVSELQAGWTVMAFPAMSLLLSGPAGILIDRRGYRFSIVLGLSLMALGGLVRVMAGPFLLLMAGQVAAAVAVPCVVTPISSVVTAWFASEREAFITGLCTVAIFIGMALALFLPPVLVASFGFRGSMVLFAGVSLAWVFVFLAAVPRAPSAGPAAESGGSAFRSLLRNRNLVVLFFSAFLGQGCFNALTTWLEPIWHERGISSAVAGQAGSIIIAGGMLGSIVVPRLGDAARNPRRVLWLCLIPAMLMVKPFVWSENVNHGFLFGALMGFLWLPTLAVSLTVLDLSAGKEHAGAAAGLFWTAGNAGVVGLTMLLDIVKRYSSWTTAITWLVLLLLVMNVLTGFLRPMRSAQR